MLNRQQFSLDEPTLERLCEEFGFSHALYGRDAHRRVLNFYRDRYDNEPVQVPAGSRCTEQELRDYLQGRLKVPSIPVVEIDGKRLLTADHAAAFLGVTSSWFHRRIKKQLDPFTIAHYSKPFYSEQQLTDLRETMQAVQRLKARSKMSAKQVYDEGFRDGEAYFQEYKNLNFQEVLSRAMTEFSRDPLPSAHYGSYQDGFVEGYQKVNGPIRSN